MLAKRTGLTALAALRPATCRSLSTSAARGWATPTNQYPPNDPRGGAPVDDIDVVFDYPSAGQSSYQKQPLEQSGLDLHSAMPHHHPNAAGAAGAAMRAAAGQKGVPGAKMGRDVTPPDGNNMLYVGGSVIFSFVCRDIRGVWEVRAG